MNKFVTDNATDAMEASCCGEELVGQILGLIGDAQPLCPDERRSRERFPIYCKLLLMPIDRNQKQLADETSIIFGKDLSVSGISISHELPLTHRRVAVSFTHTDVGQLIVEAEIIWTRKTAIGLYESGCRLIRKIDGHRINLIS